jgi:hypothetical protein
MAHPMMCVPISTFLEMEVLASYDELKEMGQVVAPPEGAAVHFISHQWLGFKHADPKGDQLRRQQYIFKEIIAGRGETLFTEADWKSFLQGVSSGSGAATKAVETSPSGQPIREADILVEHVKEGFVWIDFCSVPQLCDRKDSFTTQLADNLAGVNSIPAYVEWCEYFWVLAPTAPHADTGELCDFSTWRSRGWCRLEEWIVFLGTRRKMPLIVTDAPKIKTIGSIDWALSNWGKKETAVCSGSFSCCRLGHKVEVDGELRQIPCDKAKVAPVLNAFYNYRLGKYRESGKRLMHNMFYVMEGTMFVGSRFHTGEFPEDETVDEFLERTCFATVDDKDELGNTPLTVAMMNAHPDLVKRIAVAKPDCVMLPNSVGVTPLMWGATRPDDKLAEIMAARVGFEDPGSVLAATKNGNTPLHYACGNGMTHHAAVLLEYRADPDAKRLIDGRTPLHFAANAGYPECVEVLLRHGAQPEAYCADGCTGLHLAADSVTLVGNPDKSAKLEVIELLLQHRVDPGVRNQAGKTAIEIAEETGFQACAEVLSGGLMVSDAMI